MKKYENIEDVVSGYTRGLIVGYRADETSLKAGEFFMGENDDFWKLIYHAFGEEYTGQSYKQKLYFIRHHRIGLCYVQHLIDEPLADEDWGKDMIYQTRALMSFFQKYPDIQCLFFNGFNAHRQFHLYNKHEKLGREIYFLPSSIQGEGEETFAEKQQVWKELLPLTPQYDSENELN